MRHPGARPDGGGEGVPAMGPPRQLIRCKNHATDIGARLLPGLQTAPTNPNSPQCGRKQPTSCHFATLRARTLAVVRTDLLLEIRGMSQPAAALARPRPARVTGRLLADRRIKSMLFSNFCRFSQNNTGVDANPPAPGLKCVPKPSPAHRKSPASWWWMIRA